MSQADRHAAIAWKERFEADQRQKLADYNAVHSKANNNHGQTQAFNALVYGLKLAAQAAPDFLWQMDIDRAARMLLEAFPPQSAM
jgi:hypothetical protein